MVINDCSWTLHLFIYFKTIYKSVPFHRRPSQTSLPPVPVCSPQSTQRGKSLVHLCPKLWTEQPGTNYPAKIGLIAQARSEAHNFIYIKMLANAYGGFNNEPDMWTYNVQFGQHCLQWHVLHVSGKAFIEPQVIPPAHRYQISKPLQHNIRDRLGPDWSTFSVACKHKGEQLPDGRVHELWRRRLLVFQE